MLAHAQTDRAASMNAEQIFPLIDSILPFEVCLHYQILPLSLKDNWLELGVVDPDDEAALSYVQKILAYMNCAVVTQKISSEEQRSLLSSYLYHTQKSKHPENQSVSSSNQAPSNSPQNTSGSGLASPSKTQPTQNAKVVASSLPQTVENISTKLNAAKLSKPETTTRLARRNVARALEIEARYLSSPVEKLAALPPQELLSELLSRVLMGGIGRLYFERQKSQGRILWSQDGILQSVMSDLDPILFQGVINELKRLVELPLIPTEKPRQIEIERCYKNTLLLLRLRLTPTAHGEEANLQVLRGAALKFYHQQQLSKLSLDGLRLAQQLQHKISEIRDRIGTAPMSTDNLFLLQKLLKTLTQQTESLIAQTQENPPEESGE